jgi:hypothetical protein
MNVSRATILVVAILLAACSERALDTVEPEVVSQPRPTEIDARADDGCWYGGCAGPFYSATPVRFGRFEVGEELEGIPGDAVARSGDCSSEDNNYHCAFTTTDGIEYVMFERYVARKRLVVSPGQPLPFGLRSDATVVELAAVMRDLIGVESRIVARDDGVTLITHVGTMGSLDHPQWLYFNVDRQGRFAEIVWQGPPAM